MSDPVTDVGADIEHVRAPWVDRFGADLIDYVLIGLVTFVPLTVALQDPTDTRPLAVMAVAHGLAGLYEVVCVALWGKTIGRHVMRTEVVLVDADRPVGLWRAFVRWCLKMWVPLSYLRFAGPAWEAVVAAVVPAAQFVIVGSIVVSPTRRGLHDLAAGTIVVSRRKARDDEPA